MIKLRELVEDTLQESVYDKGIFKAVFFAGIPGSGKSYTISKITDGSVQPQIVNFDKYAEYLGKKLGIKDVGGEVDDIFIDTTKRMSRNQLVGYINSMLPLFIDSTSNKMNRTIYRDGLLKSFGYDTAMVWINTPLDVAIKRIQQRERSVPVNFVKAVHKNIEENMGYYQNHFELFLEIKNGSGELNNEILLDAYKKISAFFKEDVKNPVGRRNKNIAEKTSAYLVPKVYSDMNQIKSKLVNWY